MRCTAGSGSASTRSTVLPTIGSKELVAWLPTLLGLGAGDTVVIPELAYPTYEVGARLARAELVRSRLDGRARPAPGRAGLAQLAVQPDRPGAARPRTCARSSTGPASGAPWWPPTSATCRCPPTDAAPPGRCRCCTPTSAAARTEGLLAVHSLSKSSNLAGYRAGFVAGDPALVAALLEVRKHAGMMMPRPVQAAMAAAAADDAHVLVQAAVYARRRAALRAAIEAAGLRVEHSEAGLYLWATAGEPVPDDRAPTRGRTVSWWPRASSTDRPAMRYVRIALTATDERIAAATERLTAARLIRG